MRSTWIQFYWDNFSYGLKEENNFVEHFASCTLPWPAEIQVTFNWYQYSLPKLTIQILSKTELTHFHHMPNN